jgi:hypothetical protein
MQIQNLGLDYTPTHARFVSSTVVHILQTSTSHHPHEREYVSIQPGILFLRKKTVTAI